MFKVPELAEQQREERFKPVHTITVKFAGTRFDAVMREKDGEMGQWMGDLKGTLKDVKEFEISMSNFGMKPEDNGPDDIYKLIDPTWAQVLKVQKGL